MVDMSINSTSARRPSGGPFGGLWALPVAGFLDARRERELGPQDDLRGDVGRGVRGRWGDGHVGELDVCLSLHAHHERGPAVRIDVRGHRLIPVGPREGHGDRASRHLLREHQGQHEAVGERLALEVVESAVLDLRAHAPGSGGWRLLAAHGAAHLDRGRWAGQAKVVQHGLHGSLLGGRRGHQGGDGQPAVAESLAVEQAMEERRLEAQLTRRDPVGPRWLIVGRRHRDRAPGWIGGHGRRTHTQPDGAPDDAHQCEVVHVHVRCAQEQGRRLEGRFRARVVGVAEVTRGAADGDGPVVQVVCLPRVVEPAPGAVRCPGSRRP